MKPVGDFPADVAYPQVETRDLLNAQTGRILWPELARHFARGILVCVDQDQDLIAVAEHLVRDHSTELKSLIEAGTVHRARDEEAIRWARECTEFWAVVVAPWVLVQER